MSLISRKTEFAANLAEIVESTTFGRNDEYLRAIECLQEHVARNDFADEPREYALCELASHNSVPVVRAAAVKAIADIYGSRYLVQLLQIAEADPATEVRDACRDAIEEGLPFPVQVPPRDPQAPPSSSSSSSSS